MAHKRLSPSKAKRWILCPASPDREVSFPDDDGGVPAQQGTNAHCVLEAALLQNTWPPQYKLKYPAAGLPDELIQQAKDCYEYVLRRTATLREAGPVTVRAESKVSAESITGRRDMAGTADTIIVTRDFIEVIDLKTGGTYVDADDPQLLIYGLGVLAEYMTPESDFKIQTTVYQPKRPGTDSIERTYETTQQDLLQWATEVLRVAAARTDEKNPVAIPGDEQCHWCKARNTCPERIQVMQSGTQELVPQQQDPMLAQFDVNQLTAAQIRAVMEAAPLIKARLKDIETRAVEMLQKREAKSEEIGAKLVRSIGNRSWALTDEEMDTKLKNMKIKKDVYTMSSVRSPAQLQKQGLPAKTWQLVEKYVTRKEGGLTLAPLSDKRTDAMAVLEHFKPVEQAPAPVVEAVPVTYDFLN